ncbi:helix-turn-helix transcriptional regulator [Paraclostridium ghonii]|uniref:helix-turn-helix transcriptional regulator n=1 Tax=Paraclostridium ghonii TaxID=29358 RepID=UPI00202CD1D9|nr:helix-turn-helix transcriptional regulator [Paeniclostridium ghonii]MCM0165637.1 helix-turn-helix domain-containing protein [Paeniclostridium ghonii]
MNTLVDFRNLNNLTQKQMADKIGVTLSMYSKVELGLRNPSYDFLVKFKKVFKDINIDSIFFTI